MRDNLLSYRRSMFKTCVNGYEECATHCFDPAAISCAQDSADEIDRCFRYSKASDWSGVTLPRRGAGYRHA